MFSKIYIEITNKCNLNCSFCSKTKRAYEEISPQNFELIIKKIKPYTKCIYLHIKGEPLLHSKLDEILTICDKSGLNVKITTNGTLLKENSIIISKHRIKQINVSLHCEQNYEDYFEKVFSTCDFLKNKISIVYRIWTLNNMVISDESKNIIEKIIDHYKLKDSTKERILKEKNIKIFDNIYLDKENQFIWPDDNKEEIENSTCLGTRSHIGILSNGVVVPCCLDGEGNIPLGNIYEDEMVNIISSNTFKQINTGFKNNKAICDLCKKCNYRNKFLI